MCVCVCVCICDCVFLCAFVFLSACLPAWLFLCVCGDIWGYEDASKYKRAMQLNAINAGQCDGRQYRDGGQYT